ncbi:MAG: VENN motif pre-toxin domain-containing protein [Alphaproteobacteria bacterium]|nr:VENN motif pre-toxin domain-containing protein [Alphaproteobacteria bacterium]
MLIRRVIYQKPPTLAHAALGCGYATALGSNCGIGALSGVTGELIAEAYLGYELQSGISKEETDIIQNNGTQLASVAGAIAAFVAGGNADNINSGSSIASNAAENNALDAIWDSLFVAADGVKIGYGYFVDDDGLVKEGYYDLASDSLALAVPFLPAGSTRLVRVGDKVLASVNGAKKVNESVGNSVKDVKPDINNQESKPEGPYSSFKYDKDKNVYQYTTYEKTKTGHSNPIIKFDGGKPDGSQGKPHTNKITEERIPTPHMQGKTIPGGVRKPNANELPNNSRFN